MRIVAVASALVFVAAARSALGDDLDVPGQYDDIGPALVHAKSGDRVLVHGGVHTLWPSAFQAGVTIEGVGGATLSGSVAVTASGVVIRGFKMADATVIHVQADDVTVSDNSSLGRARWSVQAVGAKRATVVRNRFAQGAADGSWAGSTVVEAGPGAVVRANKALRGDLYVVGDGASITDNQFAKVDVTGDDVAFEGNRTSETAALQGARAVVRANRFRAGLSVQGDDATVRSNRLTRGPFGIEVIGASPTVVDNVVQTAPARGSGGCSPVPAAIDVQTDGAPAGTIENNRVDHRVGPGIRVHGVDAAVRGNVIRGATADTSVTIQGFGGLVVGNDIRQSGAHATAGDGIDVSGENNVVRANRVTGSAGDAIAIVHRRSSGVTDGTRLVDNVIASGRGCGIRLGVETTGTSVEGCDVSGCAVGLANEGAGTTLQGSRIVDNRTADVVDVDASAGLSIDAKSVVGRTSRDAALLPAR